jgi:hypothetical protein
MEVLIPDKAGHSLEDHMLTLTNPMSQEMSNEITRSIGDRKCWNLIDFRNKENSTSVPADYFKNCHQVMFASPDSDRWKDFWFTDAQKGQEPISFMPVWTGAEFDDLWEMNDKDDSIKKKITHEELEILVSLFGPSPRYSYSQFILEDVGKSATEIEEEVVALRMAITAGKKMKSENGNSMCSYVCSSEELLNQALSKVSDDALRLKAKKAALTIKGRIMIPGVVEELEDIHDSPLWSRCKSNVSSRLLIWGVPGDSSFSTDIYNMPYVNYASPYIAKLVLEHNSKQALRSMARFFESGDRNVGSGSGWMYENFILSFYLPSLKKHHVATLQLIGSNTDTINLTLPESYKCVTFGNLNSVAFEDGTMYLPTYRTLGAADCMMYSEGTLYLFQVTIAASHSIVKQKLDELKEKAREKLGTALKHVEFVFIIPSWRKDKHVDTAQNQTASGRVIRLTGELKKDTKETLQEAIKALENDLDVKKRKELYDLHRGNKQISTTKLRQELKNLFAEKLVNGGYQDLTLKSWSVPRLLATHESKTFLEMDVTRQSIWVVGKGDMPGTATST